MTDFYYFIYLLLKIAQQDNNLINESAMEVHQKGKVITIHWLYTYISNELFDVKQK